jgi:hypothetical protein
MQSTSLKADSRMRMVLLLFEIFSCLTSGITTADEVPPIIAPNIKATRGSKSRNNQAKNPITISVAKKLRNVSKDVPLRE